MKANQYATLPGYAFIAFENLGSPPGRSAPRPHDDGLGHGKPQP